MASILEKEKLAKQIRNLLDADHPRGATRGCGSRIGRIKFGGGIVKGFFRTALLILVGLDVSTAQGQVKVSKQQAQAAAQLGNTFTTSALRSLRTIDSFDGSIRKGVESTRSSEREVLTSLEDAQDDARSKAEMRVVAYLKNFLKGKLANNDGREEEIGRSWDAWLLHHKDPDEDFVRQAREANRRVVLARDVMVKMADHEAACHDALDAMLRSGTFTPVDACNDVAVSVETDLQLH